MDRIEELIGKLKSSDLSSLAANALANIGEPAVPALAEALKDNTHAAHRRIADTLFEIGKAAVPGFIEALESDNKLVVRMVVDYLGRLQDVRAVPSLIMLLDNPDFQTRFFSSRSLKKIIEKCDSLEDLLEIKTKLKEFLSPDKKELSYYPEIKHSVSILLLTVNAGKNQLIAVDINLDKRFRPPVKRDDGAYRMRASAIR